MIALKLGVLTLKTRDVTPDPQALDVLETDPLTKGEAADGGAGRGRRSAARQLRADHLAGAGSARTEDHAAVCRGSDFHALAGSADMTPKLCEGHSHDLLNDLVKEAVIADILGWTGARLAARA